MYSRSAKGGEKGDPNRNPWLAKMAGTLIGQYNLILSYLIHIYNQGPTGGIYIYNMSIYYLQLFYNITKKMETPQKNPALMFSSLV